MLKSLKRYFQSRNGRISVQTKALIKREIQLLIDRKLLVIDDSIVRDIPEYVFRKLFKRL